MAEYETTLARHQKAKGEPLYKLADRLQFPRGAAYKIGIGRPERQRQDGDIAVEYSTLAVISADTGIPIETLYREAAEAVKHRREADGKAA